MEAKIPQSTQWKKIDDFLNKNLRSEVSWALKDEYPLAFAEKNLNNARVISEGEDILAHAVLKPNLVKTHYHLFKVGFIGSVVTDKQHRGKGLSSSLIKSCLSAAEEQSCDFAMLWTDLFNFYSQFGFEVAGSEIALQTTKKFNVPPRDGLKIIEGNKVSPDAVHKLYKRHSLQTIRQASDIAQYMKIPNTKVLTGWSSTTGELEAYIVIGKGADFANYIHEWGGNVSAILALIQYQQNKQKEPLTLITPPQCTNLIKKFEDFGGEQYQGILGMIKITNPESFCKKIKKGARSLGYDSLIFDYKENKYFFGYGEEVYQTDSDQDIIRLCFGPMKPSQIHTFNKETLDVFNDIFPIPFWVWGWDSI